MSVPTHAHGPFQELVGYETLTEGDRPYLRLHLRRDLLNPHGVLHGGVSLTLLDAIGGRSLVGQLVPATGQRILSSVTVTLTTDSWVVAEVTGTQSMFPVISPVEFPPLDATVIIGALASGIDLSSLPITSNLKPQRLHTATPYAITNPIWIDRDNNGWTSPKAPLPTRLHKNQIVPAAARTGMSSPDKSSL